MKRWIAVLILLYLSFSTSQAQEFQDVNIFGFDWSPDSQQIVFVSTKEGFIDIWTIDISSGIQQNLTEDSQRNHEMPDWSPDGRYIAFVSYPARSVYEYDVADYYASDIEIMELATGQRISVTTDIDLGATFPQWSPDGERLMFYLENEAQTVGEIIIVSKDGTLLDRFKPNDHPPYGNTIWSPDGEQIAFTDTQQVGHSSIRDLYTFSLKERTVQKLTDGHRYVEQAIWASNGEFLIFVNSYNLRGQLWYVNADGSDLKMITPIQDFTVAPDLSPDNTELVFYQISLNGNYAITLSDPVLNHRFIIFQQEKTKATLPQWSPDGQYIAFIGETLFTSNLWLININGSPPFQLTTY